MPDSTSFPSRTKWLFPDTVDEAEIQQISAETGISPLTVEVLFRRGFVSAEAVRRFLRTDPNTFHDPYLLPDMAKAVDRILQARDLGQRVVVYGDYDCDGITSTYTLISAFRALGIDTGYYIPNRLDEGYGLNSEAISDLAQEYQLLVTVDSGISAIHEVDLANSLGLDVVVTDHHTPGSDLPSAVAVINPKIPRSSYPFPDLAGVGVAMKLAEALWQREAPQRPAPINLGIVMLGTIADIVPLLGENRAIVTQGMTGLTQNNNPGILALVKEAGFNLEEVTGGHVGFNLAPRINAAGRLGQADLALKLFLTTDQAEAAAIAQKLSALNTERQNIEDEILSQSVDAVEATWSPQDKAIVVAGQGWHSGVVGIVASRLVGRYCRPTVVISLNGESGHGSARSVPGVNIYDALSQCSEDLLGFGGHSGAAGLSIATAKVDQFRKQLCSVVDKMISTDDLVPQVNIDALASLDLVTEELIQEFSSLEPFGCDNHRPMLAARELEIVEARKVGREGSHLKLQVRQGSLVCDGIGFGLGGWSEILERYCGQVEVAFAPELNEWRGQRSVQLQVKDIRIPEEEISPIDQLFIDETAAAQDPYYSIGEAEEFFTKAVGVTFEGRQDVVASLAKGEGLELQREPENPHDSNAVKIVNNHGNQVGYLKREIARHLAPLLDEEVRYLANVSEVTGGGEGQSLGVNLFLRREVSDAEYLEWLEARTFRGELCVLSGAELDEAIRKSVIDTNLYRPKQVEALESLRLGKNTLLIMGTGRGKSAVFQSMAALKALQEKLVTIITYPLRALVNDQLRSMQEKLAPLGLRVLKATGSLNTREREELNAALHTGEVDVILATPEFVECNLVNHPGIRERLGLFVVDESHHVGKVNAQRSSYRNLDRLRAGLGSPLTLAVTATAGDEPAAAIKAALSIDKVVIDPHIRANLEIVEKRGLNDRAKLQYLIDLTQRGEKVIVYVNSRDGAANLARDLRRQLRPLKDSIAFYHGGLTNSQRVMVEEMFARGALTTIVSTSAFGEGVDIPDIRHVLHYHLTFNFTDFNQQSGRAGRDGQPAYIHLLYNQQDVDINRFILKSKSPEREVLAALYRVLAGAADQQGAVTVPNSELAERMVGFLDGPHAFRPSPETVSSGLGVLFELGLLDREKSGRGRIIYLAPRPKSKLDLAQSVRYNEGIAEKEAFEQFQQWALQAPQEEILAMINRPIYPKSEI